MRFVTPDVVRIDLKDSIGAKGETVKNWIEIRKELSKGEDAGMRSSGLKRLSQGETEKATAVDVDWKALGMGRVVTYLVDWSARRADDKPIKCTPAAIAELATEDFEEIDEAILAHIKKLEEEKKARTGRPQLVPTSS